jgi:hypothetical protein
MMFVKSAFLKRIDYPQALIAKLVLFCCMSIVLWGDESMFDASKTISIEEINVGDEGVWQTVVRGTELSTFPLRVLGVVDNFAGPRRPVIICEALDLENKESGPVAGMSGSPVYINGKLAGAYAYGFLWPKNQAIIGVTPIAQMIEVLEKFPEESRKQGRSEDLSSDLGSAEKLVILRGDEKDLEPLYREQAKARSFAKKEKLTLFSGGISPEILEAFHQELDEIGVHILPQSASTGGAKDGKLYLLEPGYPIAGVLMDGDFNFVGVGTITWKDGDTLLGFGHPYFQNGAVEIPMAGANILTVVQSVSKSFKLSQAGKVQGSIFQDRLTAIAGKIGREAYTFPVSIAVDYAGKNTETYSGNLFEDKKLSALLSAISVLQSMSQSMEKEAEQSYKMDFKIGIEGYSDIEFSKWGAGFDGAFRHLIQYYQYISSILDNPFKYPRLSKVEVKVRIEEGLKRQNLVEFNRTGPPTKAGEATEYKIHTVSSQGTFQDYKVTVPFKDIWDGEELEFLISDANGLKSFDQGFGRSDFKDFQDILDFIAQEKPNNMIYLRIIRKSTGLRVQGQELHGLPRSVMEVMTSPNIAQMGDYLDYETLWEDSIELPVEFNGYHQFKIYVR